MQVIFIYGPAASGKHTIGSQLSRLTGLPLFHNHLAVDAALSLFEFGTQGFKNVRAAVWRAAFREAARSSRSFIFTFLYRVLEEQGAFAFPRLPTPLLCIDTSELPPEVAANQIANAIERGAVRGRL